MDPFDAVKADVANNLRSIFEPVPDEDKALELLSFRDASNELLFKFTPADLSDGEVVAVPWRYTAIHRGNMVATTTDTVGGITIPTLDPAAPTDLSGNSAAALAATNRPVAIVGVTLVVRRAPGSPDTPMMIRVIDWADVFSQLGFALEPRVRRRPEHPDQVGFQRIADVIATES